MAPGSRSSAARRLALLLARAGLASRREAEQWILSGRVELNGEVVRSPATSADPRRDRIRVDGRPLPRAQRARTLLLYKPRGFVTTTRDPRAKRTVLELVPAGARLFPVGRLDASSEGLLLMTNDGALAHALLHPSFGVARTYRASVEGAVALETLRRLARGVRIGEERAAPCEARILRREPGRSVLELVLREGKNREVRRMLEAVGHPVRRLVRTQFGPLELRGLRPGGWRALSSAELDALARLARSRSAASRQPIGRRKPS